jgi:hypothetical protein
MNWGLTDAQIRYFNLLHQRMRSKKYKKNGGGGAKRLSVDENKLIWNRERDDAIDSFHGQRPLRADEMVFALPDEFKKEKDNKKK